jgi:signal transduction histidine kinase/putative methionine-R-sulfoxide reductase with GAF domain
MLVIRRWSFVLLSMSLHELPPHHPLRQRPLRRASLVLVSLLWVLITLYTFLLDGVRSIGLSGYILVILAASLLLESQAGVFFFFISIITGILAYLATINGLLPALVVAQSGWVQWLSQAAVFIAIGVLLYFAFRSYNRAVRQAHLSQQRIERRAMQIQVAAEVARDAAVAHDVDNLVKRAVELIRSRFGFYHAGIFLLDETREYAVLKAATGEAGEQMLANGHRLKAGEVGIVGYVAGSGLPRIALDVGQDAVHFYNPLLPETRSEMALPLKINNIVMGVLDVQSKIPGAFEPDDIAVLQTLADQIGSAFEAAHLLDATRRQIQELIVLQKVATAGAEAASEHILIDTATRVIGSTLSPDNYGIILLDQKTGLLHANPSYQQRNNITQIPIPLGSGVCGLVALHGSLLRIADVTQDPAYLAVDAEIRAQLCVPLKAGSGVLGVINTESLRPNAFSADDERLLSTLAGQLATAIEKTRLLEETQRQVHELGLFLQASSAVSTSLDLETVLSASVRQITSALGAEACSIQYWDQQGDALVTLRNYSVNPYWQPEATGTLTRLSEFPATRRVLSGRSILTTYAADPYCDPAERRWLQEHHFTSMLMVPLVARGQVIGALGLFNTRSDRLYSPREIDLCQTMANHLAGGVENARLYTEVQKRAGELATALDRLKELDHLKDEFVQNISHELRTPLTIIRGYAELLEAGELGLLSRQQREPVTIIARRVRMMTKLLEDLTAILETEARTSKRDSVDLGYLLTTYLADFENQLDRAELRLETEIDPDLPPVAGNPGHLLRVVDNLLGNALKFTPAGGCIRVRLLGKGESVLLEVSDTGIGIPFEKQGRIFERFYQVDGSATRRYGGIGLGLALVKEVVEAHGGQVTLESAPGQGTTFRVHLPIQAPIPQPTEQTSIL